MIGSVASAMVAFSLISASPQAPHWESDYGKALRATRENDRPLLIVLDLPSDPKSRIEPVRLAVDKRDREAESLLSAYELCHVDVSTEYGKKVAKAFKVSEFPHMAIIDKRGRKIIYRKTGKLSDSQWRNALMTHKAGNVRTVAVRKATYTDPFVQRYFDPNY